MNRKIIQEITELMFISNQEEELCKAGPADLIIIPGNVYPNMAIKAAELYQKGLAPRILVSGKYSITIGKFFGPLDQEEEYAGTYITEADFLEQVLIKHQVPKEVILKEEQATYTYENALFTKRLLEESKIQVKKVVLCCKSVHAKRCLWYFQEVFPEVDFLVIPVTVEGITKENWFRKQEGIEEVFGEFARLGQQFQMLINKSRQ